MFASMGTKRNYEELLKFDSGVIYALGGDGYRMQETAWGGGCSGGGDIIVFSPSCLTSFKLEIVTRPSEFRYTNPDSAFPLSFTVAATLVVKSLSNRFNIL